MVGKTNVGSGKLFAVIAVTYPEGSICTCSDGTKTMKAKDTSGKALFNVKAGTYTVECHTSDNSKSKSTSVTVTESDIGKAFAVTLTYELVLYSPGDTHDNVSGGWISNVENTEEYVGSIEFASGCIDIISGYHNTRNACTSAKIDLTGYSKLQFTYKWINSSTGYSTWFGISVDQNAYGYGDEDVNNSFVSYYHTPGGDSNKKITRYLDISNLSGEYYVKFQLGNTEKAQIYECRLI